MFTSAYTWLLDYWYILVSIAISGIAVFLALRFTTRYRGPLPRWLLKIRARRRLLSRKRPGNVLEPLRSNPKLIRNVILVTIVWAIAITGLVTLLPSLKIVVGMGIGIFIFLFLFPLIPGAVDSLIQRPNRHRPMPAEVGREKDSDITTRDYPPSKVGFFVYIVPGREFRIERGGKAVRGMMATDHRMYKGEQNNPLTPKHAEYWENVPTPSNYEDSHPIPFPGDKKTWRWALYSPLSILWWAWKRYVYWITGAAFTGFYPFQIPRVVPIERFVTRVKDGHTIVDRIEDYSNHYRVEQFIFPLLIGNADTKDMIPLNILLNVVGRVFNAYLTAYRTDDRWSSRLIASITDPVNAHAKTTPLMALWVANDEAVARAIAEKVLALGQRPKDDTPVDPRSPCVYGIEIDSVEIIDISPMNKEDTEKFGEKARAQVKSEAMELIARGSAAGISESIKALKDGDAVLRENPGALAIARMNADVQVAEKAAPHGNLVVMGSGQGIDATQTAILQELRRLRNNGSET